MKILLTADVTDIGFLDPIDSITNDITYYNISYGDYVCRLNNIEDTITYGNIIFDDYVCSMTEYPPPQSNLTIDIKYLCPSGTTNGLAGTYNVNSTIHNIPVYTMNYLNSFNVDNGNVTFNMFNVQYIVGDVLRPHYQRYKIDDGSWIDNSDNGSMLNFNMTGDTTIYFELYSDSCLP